MPIRPLVRASLWPRAALIAGALVSTFGLAPAAHAQVCGDANGDGNVTVADGVQALRAAAQLSSSCTQATCDLDGNGTVALVDGVNVLRKAADLSAPSNCGGGGNPDAEVAAVTEIVAPLLLFGFTAIADVGFPGAAAVTPAGGVEVDDCPDGGQRGKRVVGICIVNVDFDQCRYSSPGLGRFEFGNGLSVNACQGQVLLGVSVTDLDDASTVTFDGFFNFTPNGNGFVADGGPITLASTGGNFTLSFQQLTFDDEGQPTAGSGRIEDTDDNFTLDAIDFTVTGPATASLVATFDDGAQSSYVLNLITGGLSPA